jgi:hypothetical protein
MKRKFFALIPAFMAVIILSGSCKAKPETPTAAAVVADTMATPPAIDSLKVTVPTHRGDMKFTFSILMSQPLIPNADLFVSEKEWILDFNNGTQTKYTITKTNPANPICGLEAVDDKGKTYVICITNSPKLAILQFKSESGVLTYRGKQVE